MNIEAIDVGGLDHRDMPGDGRAANGIREPVPHGCGDGLGVGDSGHVGVRMEDDGSRHYRPGQTASPHLIDAGHMTVSEPPRSIFERP